MNKDLAFKENWREFVNSGYDGRPMERVKLYDVARMFFEIGFGRGVLSDVLESKEDPLNHGGTQTD